MCGRQWLLPFGCTAWCFFCLQNPAGYYARYKWWRVGDKRTENASVASSEGWSVRGRRGWGGPAQPEEMTMTGDRKDRLATNLSHVNLPNRFWNPAKLMWFKGKTPHPHILGGDSFASHRGLLRFPEAVSSSSREGCHSAQEMLEIFSGQDLRMIWHSEAASHSKWQ